jgi:DNA-binding MarR family transcriptional regulator
VRDFNRALQPHGLRSRHYTVLVIAAAGSGRSQRDLSDLLAVDPSGIVAIVDELERGGLVRRVAGPDDRRTRLVVATEAGRARLEETEQVARSADDRLVAGLDESERQVLRGLLERIARD